MSYRSFTPITAVLALATAVALSGAARAQQPIVIKFSHVVALHKDNEGRVGKDTIEPVYVQAGFKP